MKNIFFITYLQLIFQVKSIYYLSFYIKRIDDCLTKIYKNDNKVLYQHECKKSDYLKVPKYPVIFQEEYKFGEDIFLQIFDKGNIGAIEIDTRINEYMIKTSLQKFWRCINCKTNDNNYIYNSNKNSFYIYSEGSLKENYTFTMVFNINSEEELIYLYQIVEKNYYTLNQNEINYTYINNFNKEITLIDFGDKNNFFVTHNISHIIPFETIYFQIYFNETVSNSGKIMGYNFQTKNYTQLFDKDFFQINKEYPSLNYIFSENEKNNHGAHVKLSIIVYNSPKNLSLSQTVSNLGSFEFYFCEDGYNICDSDFYLNCINEFKCFEYCPNKINNSINKCQYCHPDCRECDDSSNENNSNCKSCSSSKKYLKYGKCVDSCINGYYNDTEDSSIKICKCDLLNCSICSIESLYYNSCITCNEEEEYFQIYNDNLTNNSFVKCYKSTLEGYYLEKPYFKKCYKSCKNCFIGGNESYHNCIECNENYEYEIQYEKYKNCYINCSNYYYYDNITNKYYCTETDKCNEKYNKLIYGTKECIEECNQISRYNYKNECYIDCPKDTIISKEKSYYCEAICPREKPYEMIKEQECVESCSLNLIKKKLCINKYEINKEYFKEEKINNISNEYTEEKINKEEEIKAQNIILDNFEKGFTSEDYDTSDLDNGENEVYEYEKMTITLSTSDSQKNNEKNNFTTVDLGNCEILLRKHYKIAEDKKLYIKKIDIPQEGMNIPKIEYNVYCKLFDNNLIRLNLTVCENTKISMSIPFTIVEDIKIYNSSSEYYNDICYTTTSENGTYISLKDRKTKFIKDKKTVCQDDCQFSEYDYDIKKAKCSCKVKESSSSFADMNINEILLSKNFIDFKNIANVNILGCFHALFSKKGILPNIGFYTLIIIGIIHIILIIIFKRNDLDLIYAKINDIIFAIKNWGLIKNEEKKKIIIKLEKRKTENNVNNKKNKELQTNIDKVSELDNDSKSKKIINQINNFNAPIKKRKSMKLNYNNNKNLINIISSSKKEIKHSRRKSCANKTLDLIAKKEIIEKTKNIMAFDDEELNSLPYDLAMKYDHRTYCEYYVSLLKTKHILIFSFMNNKDYNSRIIKIDLFFIGFATYFSVNALFFNDDTMHKIYEDRGSFNFIYQLPQILYSSIISGILNALLKLLALSENSIIKFKQNKNKADLNDREMNLKNKLKIKFIIYFILGFIFLGFFWYYLSMFCAIYANTQIHLIKDTLISFGLSFIYPFFIYIIPAFIRISSLSKDNTKKNYLYNLSKCMQMI